MKGNIYIKVNKIVYKHSVCTHPGNRIHGKALNYEDYLFCRLDNCLVQQVAERNKDVITGPNPVMHII